MEYDITKLRASCYELGYVLRSYQGAGSLAAAMLSTHKVKRFYGETPKHIEC